MSLSKAAKALGDEPAHPYTTLGEGVHENGQVVRCNLVAPGLTIRQLFALKIYCAVLAHDRGRTYEDCRSVALGQTDALLEALAAEE